MTETAKLLDKKQEVLAEMFGGTFEGMRFLYDGNGISENIEGTGLVPYHARVSCFTETLKMNSLRGSCLALAVY